MLLKLLPDCEVDLVVPEGAQGLGLELVSLLDDHLRLVQVGRDLSGGEVDVWKHTREQAAVVLVTLKNDPPLPPINPGNTKDKQTFTSPPHQS